MTQANATLIAAIVALFVPFLMKLLDYTSQLLAARRMQRSLARAISPELCRLNHFVNSNLETMASFLEDQSPATDVSLANYPVPSLVTVRNQEMWVPWLYWNEAATLSRVRVNYERLVEEMRRAEKIRNIHTYREVAKAAREAGSEIEHATRDLREHWKHLEECSFLTWLLHKDLPNKKINSVQAEQNPRSR